MQNSPHYKISFSEALIGNEFKFKYITPLRLEARIGGYRFILAQDFSIVFPFDLDTQQIIDSKDKIVRNHVHVTLTATSGFNTDLISSPRILWSAFPPLGKGIHGSVIHDLLYRYDIPSPTGYFTQEQADLLFKYCLDFVGASYMRRTLMYLALKYGGFHAWKTNRR